MHFVSPAADRKHAWAPSFLLSMAVHCGLLVWLASSSLRMAELAEPIRVRILNVAPGDPSGDRSGVPGADSARADTVPRVDPPPVPEPQPRIAVAPPKPVPRPARLRRKAPPATVEAPVAKVDVAPDAASLDVSETSSDAAVGSAGGSPSSGGTGPAVAGGAGGGSGAGQGGGAGPLGRTTCVFCPEPSYPMVARVRGWEGRVDVALTLEGDGTVSDVALRQSSGHDVLDRAAVAAAKRSRFRQPGTTAQLAYMEYQFRLEEQR